MATLRENAQKQIDTILAKYPTRRAAVLPLCHLAQEEFGYMSSEAVKEVAEILQLDPTEVQGLVGFYSLLREKPGGRFVVEVCGDLPCALRGADEFLEQICEKLKVKPGDTTSDGLITLEKVMCVAACDKAPVAQIDLEYFEQLDVERFDRIIEKLRQQAGETGVGES